MRSVTTLAAKGIKWVMIGNLLQRFFQVVTMLVLARFLNPSDFGLVAIAAIIVEVLGRIRKLGMHSALIQRKEKVEEAANVFFFLNIALGLLFYAIVFLIASPLADFFGNQKADMVLRIMSMQILIEALSGVHEALTVKWLAFKRQTMIMMATRFAGGMVAIVLAVTGFGVWSLVCGRLSGSLLATFLWWGTVRWKPKLFLDRQVAGEMFNLGVRLSAASFVENILDAVNRGFVGKFLGVSSLGLHSFSTDIIQMPYQYIFMIGQKIALPAFCHIQDNLEKMRDWYLRIIGYGSFIMLPVSLGLLMLSDPYIPIIFGEKWSPATPLLEILAGICFLKPLAFSWPVYVSTAHGGLVSRILLVRFLITAPFLFYAAKISLVAVCWVELVSMAVLSLVNLRFVGRILEIHMTRMLRSIFRPALEAGLCAAAIFVCDRIAGSLFTEQNLMSFAFTLFPALVLYAAVAYIRNPDLVAEILRMAASSMDRKEEVACK